MGIRHFFAKRNGPKVLEQGPSVSNEIVSNSEKSPARKRSHDFQEEKIAFNEEWENKYMVLLKPNSSQQVVVCAMCSEEINQIKSYAMQRHYTTHEQEVQTIHVNPVTRKIRLDKVKNELIQQQKKMNIFLSRNDKLRPATLKACFVIGKHRKLFSDVEFIKSPVLADEPENVLFRDMPLSNDTVQQRIQELCIFIRNEIA
jgi:hypothetical protein